MCGASEGVPPWGEGHTPGKKGDTRPSQTSSITCTVEASEGRKKKVFQSESAGGITCCIFMNKNHGLWRSVCRRGGKLFESPLACLDRRSTERLSGNGCVREKC